MNKKLFVLSGAPGAGKSTVLNILKQRKFLCVLEYNQRLEIVVNKLKVVAGTTVIVVVILGLVEGWLLEWLVEQALWIFLHTLAVSARAVAGVLAGFLESIIEEGSEKLGGSLPQLLPCSLSLQGENTSSPWSLLTVAVPFVSVWLTYSEHKLVLGARAFIRTVSRAGRFDYVWRNGAIWILAGSLRFTVLWLFLLSVVPWALSQHWLWLNHFLPALLVLSGALVGASCLASSLFRIR